MLQGETAMHDGYEVALFPLGYLNCTQANGPDTYSHCCGTMSDWAGPNATTAYFAPVSCHRIAGPSGSDNICTYVSNDKVWTPSGLRWLAFLFMHDNYPPSATSFNQGEIIGHTGTAGFVTGDHVHLDQALAQTAPLVTDGTICSGSGTTCYYVQGGVQPTRAYYLSGNETIINLRGFNFQTYDGSVTPSPDPSDDDSDLFWWIMSRSRRQRGGR